MFDALLSKLPSMSSLHTAAITDVLRDPKGLFALFTVVALVLYGLSVGRTKALISLLSIYVAYVLTLLFPFNAWMSTIMPKQYQSWAMIGLFLALYVAAFFILSRALIRTRLSPGEISLLQVSVISVVQVGLLASIGASLVPADTARQWLGTLQPFMSGHYALWAWAAASLVVMLFVRPHRRYD